MGWMLDLCGREAKCTLPRPLSITVIQVAIVGGERCILQRPLLPHQRRRRRLPERRAAKAVEEKCIRTTSVPRAERVLEGK